MHTHIHTYPDYHYKQVAARLAISTSITLIWTVPCWAPGAANGRPHHTLDCTTHAVPLHHAPASVWAQKKPTAPTPAFRAGGRSVSAVACVPCQPVPGTPGHRPAVTTAHRAQHTLPSVPGSTMYICACFLAGSWPRQGDAHRASYYSSMICPHPDHARHPSPNSPHIHTCRRAPSCGYLQPQPSAPPAVKASVPGTACVYLPAYPRPVRPLRTTPKLHHTRPLLP